MTMYTYNAQRAPTFYVAAGVLDSSNRMVATMSEPQGGTCLGCVPTSGRLLSTPGVALFEFTSGTTGFATLPGEVRKAITKGAVAWPVAPDGLKGLWVITYMLLGGTAPIAITDVVSLVRVIPGSPSDNGIVVDSTVTTGCSYKFSGVLAGTVLCSRLTAAGAPDRNANAVWWGDQMDGGWTFYPGSNYLYNFTAKRLVSGLGDIVYIKSAQEIPSERFDAMRAAMEQAEKSAIDSLANSRRP